MYLSPKIFKSLSTCLIKLHMHVHTYILVCTSFAQGKNIYIKIGYEYLTTYYVCISVKKINN